MKTILFTTIFLAAGLPASSLTLGAAVNSVAEFDKSGSDSLSWRVVDDGVMGGLSKGNFGVSSGGILTFRGTLSLENNGGFSSIRTEKVKMNLKEMKQLAGKKGIPFKKNASMVQMQKL